MRQMARLLAQNQPNPMTSNGLLSPYFTAAEIALLCDPPVDGFHSIRGCRYYRIDAAGKMWDGEQEALQGQIIHVRNLLQQAAAQEPAAQNGDQAGKMPALAELATIAQWVCWKAIQEGEGKPRKAPLDVHTGRFGSSTDAATWGTLAQAKAARKRYKGTGVGFVFTKDAGIVGIDLDNCVDEAGEIAGWAQGIIEAVASYTEFSPSGRGVHILAKGAIPAAVRTAQVEMYDTGRYFTVTGKQVEGTAAGLECRQEVITALYEQYRPSERPAVTGGVNGAASAYGQAALADAIRRVSAAAEGTRNNVLFQQTASLVELENGGELDRGTAERAMLAAGMAAGLPETEVNDTLKSAVKKVGQQARAAPEKHEGAKMPAEDATLNLLLPSVIPVSRLMDTYFPPLIWLVEGLIAKGNLVVLGGRPKSGKSWMALQMASCLDMGVPFLERQTRQSKVLYIGLEDGERRVHQRCHQLHWQPQQAATLFGIARFDHPTLGVPGEGVNQIRDLTTSYEVVIIDTLIATLGGHVSENDNVGMAVILNALAGIAHENDATIVLLHHTGKGIHEDVFSTLRGASAIRGGYDVGLVLERKQGEREAVLHAESRDVDVESMTLRQAEDGAGWLYLGNSSAIKNVRAGKATLSVLLEQDGEDAGMTADAIAEIRGVSPQAVRKQLSGLEESGHVLRRTQGSSQEGRMPDLWYAVANAAE